MPKKIFTIEQHFDRHRDEVAALAGRVAVVLKPRGIEDRTWISDIVANLMDFDPAIASRASHLAAQGRNDLADDAVADALGALEEADGILFLPCTKEELIALLSRYSPVAVARAEADRSGPAECRRTAYQLRHRHARTGTPPHVITSRPAAKNVVEGTVASVAEVDTSVDHAIKEGA